MIAKNKNMEVDSKKYNNHHNNNNNNNSNKNNHHNNNCNLWSPKSNSGGLYHIVITLFVKSIFPANGNYKKIK